VGGGVASGDMWVGWEPQGVCGWVGSFEDVWGWWGASEVMVILVEHGKHFKTLKGSQNWSSSVASLWIIREPIKFTQPRL